MRDPRRHLTCSSLLLVCIAVASSASADAESSSTTYSIRESAARSSNTVHGRTAAKKRKHKKTTRAAASADSDTDTSAAPAFPAPSATTAPKAASTATAAPTAKTETKTVEKTDVKETAAAAEEGPPHAETPKRTAARGTPQPSNSMVIIGAGVDLAGRNFAFKDPITNNLRSYKVFGTPMVALSAELYPLAGQEGFLRDLGLTAEYATALGLKSETSTGASTDNTYYRYSVGGRYRIKLDKSDVPPVVGIGASYGRWVFGFKDAGVLGKELPDVKYEVLRLGLDARVPLAGDKFALFGSASYLDTLSAGSLMVRFENAKVAGVGATLGGAIRINDWVEARLSGDYTRFFYSLHPAVGSSYVAGGALDQYFGVNVGAAAYF